MTNSTAIEKVFKIPAANLDSFQAKMAKLNKKAAKLGVAGVAFEVVGEEEYGRKNEHTGLVDAVVPLKLVKVSGTTPRYDGWALAATIEGVETDAGTEYVVKAIPGMEIPEIYRTRFVCDHCGYSRRRNATYIVVSDQGFKQVGSSCLGDFLGGLSPEALAQAASIIFSALEAAEESEGFGSGSFQYATKALTVLAWTASCIDHDGWRSRSQARSEGGAATADDVWGFVIPPRNPTADFLRAEAELRPTAKHIAEAEAALEWVKEFGENQNLSDYEYNLNVACRALNVTHKLVGIVASAIPSYRRHIEKELRRRTEGAVSEYVGEVGKRQLFSKLTLVKEFAWATQYGTTHMYSFRDAAGNAIIWRASKDASLEQGKVYKVIGSVKSHDLYKGVKQTNLTRCDVREQD